MKNILPDWLYNAICSEYQQDYIYELRLRQNSVLLINYRGQINKFYLYNGLKKEPFIVKQDLISYIVSVATKQSYYAFDEQIKKGFISTDSGIRIGLCGTVVYENDKVKTIKNIKSLNIRISHKIYDCSKNIINYICANKMVKNTLIISPPGAGKTTMLRDLVEKLSQEKGINNILVADERFEIAGFNQHYFLGENVDVLSGTTKKFAFLEGIKTMNPTVIVADEISEESDIDAIKFASKSGVNVIVTAHAKDIFDIKTKAYFGELIQEKYFERIVVLSKRNGVGTIEGVFNENLFAIYLPY